MSLVSAERADRDLALRTAARPPSDTRQRITRKALAYAALLAVAVVALVPFAWMLSTSFKSVKELFIFPPKWIPDKLLFSNYTDLWKLFPMSRWLWNSFYITTLITVGVLATSALSAYAFARIDFPGRELIFYGFLATLMIPDMVYLVPKFALIQKLNWYNTHTALIVPALASAFGVFLLRQFFLTIPKELEEAARIDGAGHWRIFTRIVLPLAGPALATLAVFTFIGTWNDFINPLLFLDDVKLYTAQLGLSYLKDQHSSIVNYNRQMAGDVITLIPMIVVFVAAQKYYVRGIALTGTKG